MFSRFHILCVRAPIIVSLVLLGGLWGASAGVASVPDWDHDGYVPPADCQPLDPAVHPGAVDVPDLSFEDTNCDGIDGTVANSIFVAPNGSDNGTGTSASPFRTVQTAIDKATPGQTILLAGGTYDAHPDAAHYGYVTLKSGVGLYGGYEPGTWRRTPASEPTKLIGAPQAALASGAKGVTLQLMSLEGKHGPGSTVYGIRLIGGAHVVLQKVAVSAESGATGTPGSTPSWPLPQNGNPGSKGEIGHCDDGGGGGGTGGDGVGGGGRGGDGGSGRKGGYGNTGATGASVLYYGQWSYGGAGGSGGDGGNPGHNAPNPWEVGGAQSGGLGANGHGGASGSNTITSAGPSWAGPNGGTGGTGGPGAGGGGGGAGGGQNGFSINGTGTGGGGGGGGGAGGLGGTGGGVGGGSFGIYLHGNSAIVLISGSAVQTGDGGTGGSGGWGHAGGVGGAGGAGGDRDCGGEVGFGAYGAWGGSGGYGGRGGGGAGGPATKILRVSSLLVYTPDSALGTQTKSGGNGGTGGNTGSKGIAGVDSVLGTPAGPSDFDGDGRVDSADACPTIPGNTADGCPARAQRLTDADRDGVPDSVDRCPTTPAGAVDLNYDGCPDPAGPAVNKVSTSGTSASVTLDCRGQPSQFCIGSVVARTNERWRNGKLIEVASPASAHVKIVTVTVASASFTLHGGQKTILHVTLNKTGRQLLARFYTLPVKFSITGVAGNARAATFSYAILHPHLDDNWVWTCTNNTCYTRVKHLTVSRLPRSGRVEVRCDGTGCPVARRVLKPHNGRVVLGPVFAGHHLAPGTKVQMIITAPNSIGQMIGWTMRRRDVPTRIQRCLPPGYKKPVACVR
jgi:Thrombospondin type 3 repeat